MRAPTGRRLAARLALLAATLAVLAAPGAAQLPYDDPFLVSDQGQPSSPAVATDLYGNFVVAWQAAVGTSNPAIWARLYWSDSSPRTDAFQVSAYTNRRLPRVAMARSGRFVVAWLSSTGNVVEARAYLADGTPIGDAFQVSALTIGLAERPVDVAMSDAADFLVVWDSGQSPDPTADSLDILARRFDADGTPRGDPFQVNSHSANIQKHPRVAMDHVGGRYAVAWESQGSPGDDQSLSSVVARVFENDLPLGPDLQVNQTTAGEQRDPAVDFGVEGDNRFVVAWESEVSGGWWGIFSRRFLAGAADGDEVRLDAWPYGFFVIQEDPAVAATAQGDVVAAWVSNDSLNGDDPDECVDGRLEHGDGSWSEQFQVNAAAAGIARAPAVAANDGGDFVVAWQQADGIWARRYLVGLFRDGFEGGDTSGWSNVAP